MIADRDVDVARGDANRDEGARHHVIIARGARSEQSLHHFTGFEVWVVSPLTFLGEKKWRQNNITYHGGESDDTE